MRKLLIGVAVVTAAMLVVGTSSAGTTELVVSTDGLSMTFTGSSISTGALTLGGWTINADAQSNTPNLLPIFGIATDYFGIKCRVAPCASNPLSVTFSSTDFTQTTGAFKAGASAFRLTGSITYTSDSFWSASNTLGGTTSPINTHMFAGPSSGNFGVSAGGGPAGPTPYSLTLVDTYTASTVGNGIAATSSDIAPAPVPEPSTLLLFGSGLLLLVLIVSRKQLHGREISA